MKNKKLLLSLGHNSSAICVESGAHKGRILCGYEQERLGRRIKSDSNFPQNAIMQAMAIGLENGEEFGCAYVSHWFDDFQFHSNGFDSKHWNSEAIKRMGIPIVSLTSTMTHHDAHAWSALAFFESHYHGDIPPRGWYIAVADGFGNQEEVFSLYQMHFDPDHSSNCGLSLVHRNYGYDRSLGLLYQYATSFCGMKENEDEYKFLGYEVHIRNSLPVTNVMVLRDKARNLVNDHLLKQGVQSKNRTYVDVNRLMEAKEKYHVIFKSIMDEFGVEEKDKRVVIGYFIQAVIEMYYSAILAKYQIKNLMVTGGLHYNVKLNGHIARKVNYFCATPLAGDQGAAIGLYRYHEGPIKYDSLDWGRRSLVQPDAVNGSSLREGVFYFENREDFVNKVLAILAVDGVVQIIHGGMEFGPRALCNTSTLAIPSPENVDLINKLNGRNTVMPFAPVIRKEDVHLFFNPAEAKKILGSTQYMITTLDYHRTLDVKAYRGVMHPYPPDPLEYDGTPSRYSGRPQVVGHGHIVHEILTMSGQAALINTSLNVHGRPIVFSAKDAMDDLEYNHIEATRLGVDKPALVIGAF